MKLLKGMKEMKRKYLLPSPKQLIRSAFEYKRTDGIKFNYPDLEELDEASTSGYGSQV